MNICDSDFANSTAFAYTLFHSDAPGAQLLIDNGDLEGTASGINSGLGAQWNMSPNADETAYVTVEDSHTSGGSNYYVSGMAGATITGDTFDGQGVALNGVTDSSVTNNVFENVNGTYTANGTQDRGLTIENAFRGASGNYDITVTGNTFSHDGRFGRRHRAAALDRRRQQSHSGDERHARRPDHRRQHLQQRHVAPDLYSVPARSVRAASCRQCSAIRSLSSARRQRQLHGAGDEQHRDLWRWRSRYGLGRCRLSDRDPERQMGRHQRRRHRHALGDRQGRHRRHDLRTGRQVRRGRRLPVAAGGDRRRAERR